MINKCNFFMYMNVCVDIIIIFCLYLIFNLVFHLSLFQFIYRFITLSGAYLLVGFLYTRFILGNKGMDQIPNYEFWQDFGNLTAVSLFNMTLCQISIL